MIQSIISFYYSKGGVGYVMSELIKIQNPILPGFNPDPVLCRKGEDYYIATSTFEWTPAISIYHSRDLRNWRLLSHALTSSKQISMEGINPSTGVWAPCLTWCEKDNLFYIMYTIVTSQRGYSFDLNNYLITSPTIEGPWSDSIYINSSGFDPSMLHDDDGRKWVVNLEWDFRDGYTKPGKIVLQEFDATQKALIGKPVYLTSGLSLRGCVEGAHIYKYNGYYYLMTAEGGTGYAHSIMLGRSKNITGPYESSPYNPLITSNPEVSNEFGNSDFLKPNYYNPVSDLQKSGHGSWLVTHTGEHYISHLCARPVMPELRCVLGRETAIQKVIWTEDGWLKMIDGDCVAKILVDPPQIPEQSLEILPEKEDFNESKLAQIFYSLRTPFDDSWMSLSERKGYLRLYGRESLCSQYRQSLVARRLTSLKVRIETCVEFEPENFHHQAGLICYYDNMMHYYLRIYYSDSLQGKTIAVLERDNGKLTEFKNSRVLIKDSRRVWLSASISEKKIKFNYSLDGINWEKIGPDLDTTKLSDEYSNLGEFTGAFVGICCQDTYQRKIYADFDYFSYKEL
jgi:xylan 1,4-beta-xylosidase